MRLLPKQKLYYGLIAVILYRFNYIYLLNKFSKAKEELYEGWELMKIGIDLQPFDWIVQNLPKESAIGFDPELIRWSNYFLHFT